MSHNIPQFIASLNVLVNNDLPYVIARALTQTAKDCKEQQDKELEQKFILRNAFTKRYGIKIKTASKGANPIQASVYTNLDWLAQHEDGGMKTPSGKHVSVPQAIRPNIRKIIRGDKRPRAVLNRPDVFKAKLPGTNTEAIYQRLDKAGSKRSNGKRLKILYTLTGSVVIKKRLGMIEGVEATAQERLPQNFAKYFNEVGL